MGRKPQIYAANTTSPTKGRALLDVGQLAEMLGVSKRHVHRLADAGKCPAPVRLGRCARWPRSAVEAWIARGCPSRRTSAGGDQ
jgi:excisionase family DNA binding protein